MFALEKHRSMARRDGIRSAQPPSNPDRLTSLRLEDQPNTNRPDKHARLTHPVHFGTTARLFRAKPLRTPLSGGWLRGHKSGHKRSITNPDGTTWPALPHHADVLVRRTEPDSPSLAVTASTGVQVPLRARTLTRIRAGQIGCVFTALARARKCAMSRREEERSIRDACHWTAHAPARTFRQDSRRAGPCSRAPIRRSGPWAVRCRRR